MKMEKKRVLNVPVSDDKNPKSETGMKKALNIIHLCRAPSKDQSFQGTQQARPREQALASCASDCKKKKKTTKRKI